ncbi:glucosidase 2 subunit beta [Ophiostoma piceae UAMH 11346]|uniref:Glucosidase 2 subunit beta n=1 Tax=Ophiostoma piceae (strain UAMH 11346) TaxID=1262450 RepID=S3BRH1_OPHP1|nr:glucosidase 2 subunit beta [Ophiostoma piceae UAMH 11346]
MRQSGALLLAGAFASSSVVVAAASLPRGVGPEFAKYYDPKTKFTCISNPSISLDFSQINDGTCDCPDGSDEPGTAACSFIDRLSPPQPLPGSPSGTTNTAPILPGFWCENTGHIGAYIPFSFVNDGVCDYDLCCDGTEEYAGKGGVKCPNRCAAIGKEHRRAAEELKKKQERALTKRRAMVKEARQLRNQLQERVNKHRVDIVELEKKRDRLEKELAEKERSERGKVINAKKQGKAGGKLGVLVGLAKQRVDELRDTLDKVLDHRDDLQDKVNELEAILSDLKEKYNPNFNDEGVKSAVHGWEDYAAKMSVEEGRQGNKLEDVDVHAVLKEDSAENGVNWAEFETDDTATDTDILYSFDAYLPAFVRTFIHDKIAALRFWMIDSGLLADNGEDRSESAVVSEARTAFRNAETEATNSRNQLNNDEADLSGNYGPNDIFRALKDKCIKTDVAEYTYEVCWWGQAVQKAKAGGSNTLGRYESIDTMVADEEPRADGKSLGKGPRTVLRYENGQHCWNGPNRRVDVWLGCSETEEIWRVSEAEKCVYKMEVGTPIACEEPKTEAAAGKDEL